MGALVDILPKQVRKYVYALLALVSAVMVAYSVANGSWLQFAIALFGAGTGAMASANTDPAPRYDPAHDVSNQIPDPPTDVTVYPPIPDNPGGE